MGGGQSKNIYPESDSENWEIKVVAGHPANPVFKFKGKNQVAWADGSSMRGVKKPGVPVPMRSCNVLMCHFNSKFPSQFLNGQCIFRLADPTRSVVFQALASTLPVRGR